jgi:HK97 family phage major capsid protein
LITNTFTNSTNSTTASASHVGPTGDDLIDTFFKLGAQYRQGSVWLMNDSVLKSIRKLKTVTSGFEYVWKETSAAGNLVDGNAGTLLGRPIYISEFMPVLGTTISTINCVLGDFKRYFSIVDRAGMDTFVDPYSLSLNQKTNLIVSQRTDSKIINELAFSVFRNKAS